MAGAALTYIWELGARQPHSHIVKVKRLKIKFVFCHFKIL